MIREWIGAWAYRQFAKDMDNVLRLYRVSGPNELGALLLSAGMAREVLEKLESKRFPFDVLENRVLLDDAKKKEITSYLFTLTSMRKRLVKREDPLSSIMNNGYLIWQMTLWGTKSPELLARARELWNELARGEPEVESTLLLFQGQGIIATTCSVPDCHAPAMMVAS